MTYLKWALIAVIAWYAFHALSASYDSGSPNLGSDGDAVTGSGWAPPVNAVRRDIRAWAPPYGIPHEGAH